MASIKRLLIRANSIWKKEGVDNLALQSWRYINRKASRGYIHGKFKDEIEIKVGSQSVKFDTTTLIAKDWFYPRLYYGEPHEPSLTRRILETIEEDSVFYDIGAHVGYYTAICAQKSPDGNVHSFELHPEAVGAIQKTLERNDLEALVNQSAVSDESGNTLRYTTEGPSIAIENDGEYEANSVTLDRYTQDHESPDVIKIDVEGHEYHVLKGAERVFDQSPPKHVFVEIHPNKLAQSGNQVNDVIEYLLEHEYLPKQFENHRVGGSNISSLNRRLITNTMVEFIHQR